MTPLGVGLFGCGAMGRRLTRILNTLEMDASVVAVCDSDLAAAQAFGAEIGAPAYQQAPQLLQHPGIHAVIIATPHDTHMKLAVAAAGAGKHIFCEKAMALNVSECDQMLEAARSAGVVLMIGHVLRLMPVFSDVSEVLATGVLGKVVAVSTQLTGFVTLSPGSWWGIRAQSGGWLNAMSVHEFDFMRAVAGDVASVYAVRGPRIRLDRDYDETIYALFRFTSGAVGMHEVATCTTRNGRTGKVIGDEGTLTYDASSGHIEFQAIGGQPQVIECPDYVQDVDPGVKVELMDFVASIREGREPIITGRDGRAAVEMMQACYLSIERAEPIDLPLSG